MPGQIPLAGSCYEGNQVNVEQLSEKAAENIKVEVAAPIVGKIP